MFGNKRAKRERLDRVKQVLAEREASAIELAQELGVSRYAIYDDIKALQKHGVMLCEHKGKFSLFKDWFGGSRK
jgi:biotin operon repressor